MKLFSVHAGLFSCDGGALFSVIPRALWSKAYPSNENNITQLTLRCMLIDQGDRKILINAGVGDHYPEKVKKNNGHEDSDELLKSINKVGYTAEDITDVLFTHLHWDHCNGAAIQTDGKTELLFPRATHWCSKKQWEHSQISNIREKAAYYPHILNLFKEKGNLQLINEGEIFPNVEARIFDGHTPGQIIPLIKHEDKTFVYTSDLIPTTANIPILWLASYDLYPVTSMEEKEKFMREVAEKDYILFFEHDFYTECATVDWIVGKGSVLKSKYTFAELLA